MIDYRSLSLIAFYLTIGNLALAQPIVSTITENGPLKVVPPTPSNELGPDAKFRSYAAIEARLQQLKDQQMQIVSSASAGASLLGKDIRYLKISSGQARDDGSPKPAVLFTGAIHPREWISPEVVLRIAEHFVEQFDETKDDRLEFLLKNADIYIVVVCNPDGLVYTQTNFDKYIDFPPLAKFSQRDGRLRRKNLGDRTIQNGKVDFADAINLKPNTHLYEGLLGVDLNRNFSKGFGNAGGSSLDPLDLTYRGPAAASEPETKALVNLTTSIIGNKLRAHIDYHSYGEYILLAKTGDNRRDNLASDARFAVNRAIKRVNNTAYNIVTQAAGDEIGTVDEFVGSRPHQPVAFTLEMSPSSALIPNSGFILPENRIVDVANENIAGAINLAEFAVGPPYLRSLVVWMDDNGDGKLNAAEIRYEAEWTVRENQREKTVKKNDWLKAGVARFLMTFDEPMKLAGQNGSPIEEDGSAAKAPEEVAFAQKAKQGAMRHTVQPQNAQAAGWLGTKGDRTGGTIGYERYKFDSWEGTFTIPAGQEGDFDALAVVVDSKANDLLNNKLDGNPATFIDWNQGWIKYEASQTDTSGQDGGVDQSHTIKIDTKAPRVRVPNNPAT